MTTNFWGELIRQLRTDRGISERQLAREAKVNRSTLRRIEEGKATCALAVMERLLGYLGHDLEALSRGAVHDRVPLSEVHPSARSQVAASRLLRLAPRDLK